jgi:transitional endoplasmic reticulum ATPase
MLISAIAPALATHYVASIKHNASMLTGGLKMPKATRKSGPHNQDTCPLALGWMFRLIIDCGGHREFINHSCFSDDDTARELGIYWMVEADNSDDEDAVPEFLSGRARRSNVARKPSFQERALAALRHEQTLFNKAFSFPELPDNLQENLANLAELIGLDDIEQKLVGFCSLMNTDTLLDDCCNQLGYVGFNRLVRVLSTLLEIPQNDLRVRLSADGRLAQSGLIGSTLHSGSRNHISDLLAFNNSDLLFALRHHKGSAIGLFQSVFRLAPQSQLQAEDFVHLDTPLSIARPYLQQTLGARKNGVNILIYGPPGTGKSQLTRLLASELKAELYEIACTDNNGDPISRRERLCALRSAMSVLNQTKTLLVLDEIEDLFSGNNELAMLMGGSQERQKGWINRMLEENPIPCFWLTNNIRALDNAYIRRFDLVLKLENPPRVKREEIIRGASDNRLSQSLVEKLADHEQLMPAIITRAMNVANTQALQASAKLETTVEFLVNATLQAQGFARLGQNHMQALPEFYSPNLANTDMPLDQLLTGLSNHGEARLCFYGPPGTGKTAFGHWLATQLGKPLMTRRASDLISPYVGMTEQNFARAFEQATDDDAVLLLDEVDSFLQDRRKARNSWEVTAVNEMLTQMESYRGLFIASTNLMENLDEASLRRFDLKINFGYLGEEQITKLLQQYLRQMGLKKPDSLKLARLLRQDCLTPGDFALIARRARFNPFTDANQVVDALLAESSLKSTTTMRSIGFAEW